MKNEGMVFDFGKVGYVVCTNDRFKKLDYLISKGIVSSKEKFCEFTSGWSVFDIMGFWKYEMQENKNISDYSYLAETLSWAIFEQNLIDYDEVADEFVEKWVMQLNSSMTFQTICSKIISEKAVTWLNNAISDPDNDLLSNYIVTGKPWFWHYLLWVKIFELDPKNKFTTEVAKCIPFIE